MRKQTVVSPLSFLRRFQKKKIKLKIKKKLTFFVGGQNLGSSPIANSGFFATLPLRRGFLRSGEKKFHVNLKTASIKEGKKKIIKHGNALHYYTPSRYRALRVIIATFT